MAARKKLPEDVQAILSASDAGYHALTAELASAYLQDHETGIRGWLDLGHSLAQLFRYDEAQAAFVKAIELSEAPCDVALGELGNLCRAQGNLAGAADWYRKQIDADPEDATGLLFLGRLELARGNRAAAREAFLAGLERPHGVLEELHYGLGLVERSEANYAAAKKQFEQALELDPKHDAAKVALKDVKSVLNRDA